MLLLSAVSGSFLHAGEVPGDVWIISGQSNACGRAPLPGAESDPRVQMYSGKQWIPAKEPLPMLNGTVGPWLTAAVEAKAAGTIRLTGYASGGQPISHWNDGQPGMNALNASIKEQGEGAGVFLWYQGENDGASGMDAKTYQTKLTELAGKVRTQAKNPKMLVVIVQLGIWKNTTGDFMPIREAERQFVIADGNALLVPALGRPMQDGVHLNREGYFALGKEIARALSKVRYHQKDADWPGPVMDAAVLTPDGKSAGVHFAEVKQLSGCEADDFGAIDGGGQVKCLTAQAERTRVALTFERPLKLPARIVYGIGQTPKCALRDEAGNAAPAVQLEASSGAMPPDKDSAAPNGAGGGGAAKK